MSVTTEQAAVWFADRAKNTPMPGARAMFEIAAAALREKAEREDPKPLTIEELRQMIGEPVWIVGVYFTGDSWQGWDIIERVDHDGICFGYSTEFAEWWSYNLRDADGTLCGCSWCAYRHKPKEVQKDA